MMSSSGTSTRKLPSSRSGTVKPALEWTGKSEWCRSAEQLLRQRQADADVERVAAFTAGADTDRLARKGERNRVENVLLLGRHSQRRAAHPRRRSGAGPDRRMELSTSTMKSVSLKIWSTMAAVLRRLTSAVSGHRSPPPAWRAPAAPAASPPRHARPDLRLGQRGQQARGVERDLVAAALAVGLVGSWTCRSPSQGLSAQVVVADHAVEVERLAVPA
jgi:hypothetical protein